MKIWLTTDTHLGHDRMVELCGRPLNHSEVILDNLSKLREGVILIHLGDVCIGNDADWHKKLMQATNQCKRRILVLGNHDNKSDNWYLNAGWDWVCKRFVGKYFGKKIIFSHKPVPFGLEQDLNIHGHFHNSGHHDCEKELMAIVTSRHKLLAIENTDLKPVNLDKFINTPNP